MARHGCVQGGGDILGIMKRMPGRGMRLGSHRTYSTRKRSVCSGMVQRRTGVVVVDHGSRREVANDMLDGVVDLYKSLVEEEKDGHTIVGVEKAHMEIARPSILDAVRVCVNEHGAEDVVVAPYFLSKGRHIQEDIPSLVQEAERIVREESGRDVVCIVAEPLGIDRDVVKVVKQRVDSCLDR